MTTAVIEVDALHKSYRRRRGGRVRALDGLDLSVRAGGVFGFLGPNGSGKTTTIRCLLGLARPTAGRCRLLGAESPHGLPDVIGRIGALVEEPGVNPGLSGRQTLTVLATTAGIGRHAVDATLERVGLAERADDLVRGYSLGMRQRLGIGIALLKDPELLVLDEPANGLDPAGIREVRQLVRQLADEGRTVFLSSHLLSEVEQVCDEVAIVAGGRTVAHGSVADVLASTRPAAMWVKVTDLAAAADTLRRAGITRRAQRRPHSRRRHRRAGRARHPRPRRRGPLSDRAAPGRDQPRGRLLRPDRPARTGRLMARLMVAELRRIAARRLVRLTVVLALVGIAVGGAGGVRVERFTLRGGLPTAGRRGRTTRRSRRKRRSKRACASTAWTATTRSPTRSPTRASPGVDRRRRRSSVPPE